MKPTTTLFVVNFDVDRTRERDLEKHFEEYGRLKRVQIKRNYAFVQYETIEQAMDALKSTNGSVLPGMTVNLMKFVFVSFPGLAKCGML